MSELSKKQKINFIKNTYPIHELQREYEPRPYWHPKESDSDGLVNFVYNTTLKEIDDKKAIHLNIPPDKIVVKGYAPLKLYTYYPLDNDYLIGHSAIIGNPLPINKTPDHPTYNLFTNNCSDATGQCLEKIFGKKMNTVLFTTPGDVRDFAIENGGIQKPNLPFVSIPMNESRYNKYLEFLREYYPKLKDRPILNPTMASDITPKNNKPESH